MPATVNIKVGSSLISEADGTIVCPRFSKKESQRLCISAVLMPVAALFVVISPLSRNIPELYLQTGCDEADLIIYASMNRARFPCLR